MRLYDTAVSGNCYKVRLLSSILGLEIETVPINLVGLEQKSPEHLERNPLGKVPVLEDGGRILRDSQAIMVYLCGVANNHAWWPEKADEQAEVMQWLSLAANEMHNGCAVARAILKFKRDLDLSAAQALSRQVLEILNNRLGVNDWLALGRPTIADISVYPYAALVWEGDVSLAPYGHLHAWFDRIQSLPNYIPMEGLPFSAGSI